MSTLRGPRLRTTTTASCRAASGKEASPTAIGPASLLFRAARISTAVDRGLLKATSQASSSAVNPALDSCCADQRRAQKRLSSIPATDQLGGPRRRAEKCMTTRSMGADLEGVQVKV